MFDNIIGHPLTVQRLIKEIETQTPAHSLLFVGEDYCGKFTTALEWARSLNCLEKGAWNCQCSSCQQFRYLQSPSLYLLGKYDDFYEIRLTSELLKENSNLANKIKFIRALKKLTLRFDRRILSDKDLKKIDSESIQNIHAGIESLLKIQKNEAFLQLIDSLVALSQKLMGEYPSSLSIHSARNMSTESYSASEGKKVFIIEHADEMSIPVANALLKTLEEPPTDCFFILIANRQNAILPTILSRLRIFNFSPRRMEEENEVLRLFYGYQGPLSLNDYILKFSGWDVEILDRAVNEFFTLMSSPEGVSEFYKSSLLEWKDRSLFVFFWRRLSSTIHHRFFNSPLEKPDPYRQQLYQQIQDILNESKHNFLEAHQGIPTVLESVFFKIRHLLLKGELL